MTAKRRQSLSEASEHADGLLAEWKKGVFPLALCDSLLRLGASIEDASSVRNPELSDLGTAVCDLAEGLAASRVPVDAALGKMLRPIITNLARKPVSCTADWAKRASTRLRKVLRVLKPELGMGGRQVLVIDDDRVAQAAIRTALRKAGFSTVSELRGRAALRRLRRERPALIVLDVELPDIRGPQILRAIRRDPRLAGVPVIFLSARKQLDVKLEALRSGADDYITKPFRPEELATRVAARLERGAVLQELALKDPLTGVATHRFFQEKLEDEIARHLRYKSVFSVACLDVDDLSGTNDRLGYDAGDRALIRVGQFLRRGMRRSDVVARLSGGEFGIVMPQTASAGALIILDRLRDRLARGKRGIPAIGLSGGIACCPETTSDRRALFSAAREALERAKHAGKGRLLRAGELKSERRVVVAEPTAGDSSILEGFTTAEIRTLNEIFVRDFNDHLKRLDGQDSAASLRDRTRAVGRTGHFLAGAGAVGGHAELSTLGETIENACNQLLARGVPPAGTELAIGEVHEVLRRIGASLRSGTYTVDDAIQLELRLRVIVPQSPSRDSRIVEGETVDVLVVDDERVSQVAIGASLRRAGFVIREAYSGAEALEAVSARPPDIIILDIVLPDMDGHEVLARVRSNSKLQLVPVIFVTAKRMLDDKIQALSTGADDYVTKPFSPEELVARVGARLERARISKDLALRDGLTGLYNHRFFQERLENELTRSQRTQTPFCLALIDIDDFKSVNDRFGHQTGDQVLRALAAQLVSGMRSTNVVARYGGEEFAIILPESSIEAATECLDRVRQLVADNVRVKAPDGTVVRVTFSAGVATALEERKEELFERVDLALYKSKRAGKNRVTVADSPAESSNSD